MRQTTRTFRALILLHLEPLESRDQPGVALEWLGGLSAWHHGFAAFDLHGSREEAQSGTSVLPAAGPVSAIGDPAAIGFRTDPLARPLVQDLFTPLNGSPFAGQDDAELALALFQSAADEGTAEGHYINYWYNGDFDNRSWLPNISNGRIFDARVYDDFYVDCNDDPCLCILWTHNFMDFQTDRVNWEIRRYVRPNEPGEIVAMAFDQPANQIPTGRFFKGLPEYRLEVYMDPLFPVYLPGGGDQGRYWVSVTPVGKGEGMSFVGTTSGEGSYGWPRGRNGRSFFDSRIMGHHFEPTSNLLGPGRWDFSAGVAIM